MAQEKRRLPIAELSAILLFPAVCLAAIYITQVLIGSGYQGSTSTEESLWYFVFYIAAMAGITLLILFLARKNRGNYVRVFLLAVTIYVIFFISMLISQILYSLQYYIIMLHYVPAPQLANAMQLNFYMLWLGSTAILGYELFTENNWVVVNLTGIILTMGIGAIWSLVLGVWFALALLVILGVYDYISVFKTKHMVTLAKVAVDEKIPMLFAFPGGRGFDLNKVSMDDRKEQDAILLGFGDIAIPAVMVVSSAIYGLSKSFLYLLLPLLGGIAGMIALFFFMKQRPAPGLPTMNTGVIAGFLLALLLTSL